MCFYRISKSTETQIMKNLSVVELLLSFSFPVYIKSHTFSKNFIFPLDKFRFADVQQRSWEALEVPIVTEVN